MRDYLDPIAGVGAHGWPFPAGDVGVFHARGHGEGLPDGVANRDGSSALAQGSDAAWDSRVRRRSAAGLSRRALVRAYAYMEQHIGESFTLEELARAACVSRFHFARAFRCSTGHSPMAFLLNLRVERAKSMLMRGDQTISETAAALGFFDQSHFARAFRRLTGCSPREYARLCHDFCAPPSSPSIRAGDPRPSSTPGSAAVCPPAAP